MTRFRRRAGAAVALGIAGALAAGPAFAQGRTLAGTVRDAETGAPVAGATVLVGQTGIGRLTDAAGRFEVSGLSAGRFELSVAAGAYRAYSRFVEIGIVDVEIAIALDRPVFDVPDLVVTASRSAVRPGATPVSVAVLTGDEVRRRDVVSLAEALPFAQGVIFNAGQMDIRGATGLARGVGSRVLMLLDGHRVLSGVGGSIEFDALPILDLDRVEIVKGPHSALYGTNALGGVVNVITRRPPVEPETTLRGYVGLFDTPSGLDFTDERLTMQGLNLQHSRRFGDVGGTLFVGRETSDGFRQNGRYERWRVRAKTVFPIASATPWELFVNWTSEDQEEFFTWLSEDRALEVDPIELGDRVREDDLSIGVTANPIVTPGLSLQIRPHLYYARARNHFHDNEDVHESTRLGTDVQVTTHPAPAHMLTLGGEAARTSVSSNFLASNPTVADWAAYAQDEVELGRNVRGSVGVRLDYHKARDADEDVALNPKVGLVFTPSDRVSLRTSVSRGYRAPSVSEQFTSTTVFGFRVVPNLALSGESAWAAELGGTTELGERVWLDAGVFWSEYSDLIEPSPVAGEFFTFQFQNVARATVRGLDAGVRLNVVPDLLGLRLSYVFLDSEDSRTGEPLPYRSRHNLTATVAGLRELAAIDFRVRSRIDEVLAFPLDDRDAIALVDLRFAYRVLGTVIQAKIENLFQSRYVDVQERSPGQSRTFRLTVTPRF